MSGNTQNTQDDVLVAVRDAVRNLREALSGAQATWQAEIDRVHTENRVSAVNLAHYWAIRQHDLVDLQARLAALGLSSLGRSEPRVRASLEAVAEAIDALSGERAPGRAVPAVDFGDGPRILRRRARDLLGASREGRQSRIR